ncbi:MAG: beta-ketoacyl-[acyl-carrier-protein] synthase family protein [Methyloligellaceae bacterium]
MTKTDASRRVVVTGMGAVTPIGMSVDETWAAMKAGTCGIGPIETFDLEDLYITIAAEVKNFNPRDHLTNKLILLADRYSQFAAIASNEALADAKIEVPVDRGNRAAAIIGSGAGGLNTMEAAYRGLFVEKKKATHPLTLLRFIGSSAASHVGIEAGIKGPTFGTVSACATASHSIGILYDYIRHGLVDMGVAGASEAAITYGSFRSWQAMRVLSEEGCFPFSKNRNGTTLGEGAGILTLESLEHAQERGAHIYAEMMGFGMTSDAMDMVNPDIDGPMNAMKFALEDAGLDGSEIDYVNAHGTATTVNDVNETRAIRGVFGKHAEEISVSSTKAMHGHLLGAGGGVEAMAAIKAIDENFAPPTINFKDPDPECDLDYTPNEGKSREINYSMSNSFAFGGLNAVTIFGPPPA